MQNTPYHLANQAIQKLTKQMRLEILSSVNTLTETHADLFTTIPNDNDTSSLTSSLQLSSISKTLNKVEENSNLSHKDDLFNPLLLVGHLSWPKCLPKRFSWEQAIQIQKILHFWVSLSFLSKFKKYFCLSTNQNIMSNAIENCNSVRRAAFPCVTVLIAQILLLFCRNNTKLSYFLLCIWSW